MVEVAQIARECASVVGKSGEKEADLVGAVPSGL